MKNLRKNDGFTLIEILVVIGIIAILAVIVLIAINPARQFAQARNTQRTSNVNAILNAIGQYAADNKGDMPADIEAAGEYSGDAIELCADLVTTYLPALPVDPDSEYEENDTDCAGTDDTLYTVDEGTDGRITVCAPEAANETALGDDADTICVTR